MIYIQNGNLVHVNDDSLEADHTKVTTAKDVKRVTMNWKKRKTSSLKSAIQIIESCRTFKLFFTTRVGALNTMVNHAA
jgi:hypothetical protein